MAELKFIEGYPEHMYELIKVVEKTRPKRKDYTPKAMTMEEREEVLKLHPDFAPGGKSEIKVGQNKGDIAPNEVVDLLEAYPLIEAGEIDLKKPDYTTDMLIIGGGLAGTTAAVWANDRGIPKENILLVNKLRHGDSNSIMAQGGTQSADRENDSPTIHFIDVIGGGHFTNKPDVVRALAEDAPLIMQWLSELGAMFDREEDGSFVERWGGGTCRKRMHACRDYTGLEEFRVIRDEFRNRGIAYLEYEPVIELLTDGNRVTGAVLWNLETGEYRIVKATATILATGGFGRLHIRGFPTTNHYGATYDGVVIAYRAGAKLRDTDTVQYHPTGAAYPQQIIGLLLTEKLRSMGAQPVNKDGETFVFPLEPRDVEASAFIRECYVKNKGVITPTGMRGVWLDTPLIDIKNGEGTTDKAFPGMKRMFTRFGIDMAKVPVLVFPTLHYQNGGVGTDPLGKTNLEGLWVAGEVSGGVHGKNRLMGNSTLDCMVFGRRSGISAAEYVKSGEKGGKLTLEHMKRYVKLLKEAGIPEVRRAPILLPDYRGKRVLARMIDVL
ncbi:succinate dehydrogenase/fumarate reductase flavoprotein subunit [candidate division WOR-3 bacterium JGI_Cruoil_03_44_89]|uniref:Succinate dehydrogenase/fumarate reductase flavoprotein subunit n=1 Tax=candidate division WOR-3 bacterium JGI_Cruoil_03_44_89 TaxID=1973748 RepID=A0A235BRV8_UNCW3|nr:MAG: succinate dehydrogenase/fumarate reductase flavoprotein subunit [candidate division WOR-3 bacterium JGI_Cruoil_03_44_89]